MIRDDATLAQIRAADPQASTWLGANAGSGKTRVLTDRVARLLLGDTKPEHILCLTFTNAAASEMQNRLFKRLGEWAMLDDASLRDQLLVLGEARDGLNAEFLARARTLFARAIETPGGLRIQTIHAFCASILRRFPLEAGISPQFQEIDDRTAQFLREQILDDMAQDPDAHLVMDLARIAPSGPLADITESIISNRTALTPPLDRNALCDRYGIARDLTLDRIVSAALPSDELAFLASLEPDLRGGATADKKLANAIIDAQQGGLAALLAMEHVVFTAKGQVLKKLPPNAPLRKGALASAMTRLEELYQRVIEARSQRLALEAVAYDETLYRFSEVFLQRYSAVKNARGLLDFDDLITRTRDLLKDSAQAEWVLYRLDGAIDHILVDEAQDTSPAQWDVINRLAQEFTSGQGARSDVRRTIFVVGDKKQSIYSFQGADPQEFDHMRGQFLAQMRETDAPLQDGQLRHSFRSSVPILRLVDTLFKGREKAGFLPDQTHISFHDTLPGRVDLWPLIEPSKEDGDDQPWDTPVDRVGAKHHNVLLAQQIAGFIDATIRSGTSLPTGTNSDGSIKSRAVHAGDFLILVRSRGQLFQEVLRACKSKGLPIAGADKLKVMAELAVNDLRALLSFLATPEDSLSLASALRSPLLGLDEQAIFDLAHRRTAPHLWEALRNRKVEFPEVMEVIDDLRGQTDFLRPYDLLERVLIRHKGRQKLIGRLGEEAEDGIDALLGQALVYEQTDIPSLTGFLHWMETDDVEIKRSVDSAGSRVRVMTIHGAKGLEAPIVIVPDTHKWLSHVSKETLIKSKGNLHWRGHDVTRTEFQQTALDHAKQAEEEERDRLLYVALTRAERWLVVAGAGAPDPSGESWHDRVSTSLKACGAFDKSFEFEDGTRNGQRLEHMVWPPSTTPRVSDSQTLVDVPAFFDRPAPPMMDVRHMLSPSDLGGAKALPGADGDLSDVALDRGTQTHLLLETLATVPRSEWEAVGSALLRNHPLAEDILSESICALENPELAFLFDPETLAEVPLTATISQFPNSRFSGIIDRLIVTDTKIIAIDFKTNRTVPTSPDTCPDGLLRQMGAYRAMLAAIYPRHDIETAILWTRTATYMPLPETLTTQALVSAHHLDAPTEGT